MLIIKECCKKLRSIHKKKYVGSIIVMLLKYLAAWKMLLIWQRNDLDYVKI
jgi:hypothetical protein